MIVVDASVAVKWFAPEAGHHAALDVLASSEQLIAPDLVVAETMHALRRKLRAEDITEEQYIRAGSDLPTYFDEIVPSSLLVEEATRLSIRLDHGFYDCVYLALALTAGARLVTADHIFEAKATASNVGHVVGRLGAELQRQEPAQAGFEELVTQIDRLANLIEATFTSLKPARRPGERFEFISTSVYAPAFDSPAYRRLKQLILDLPPGERVHVIALGWFGRDYERGGFDRLIDNARLFADDPEKDVPYIISVMGTVRAGFEKLRATQTTE